MNSSVSVYYNLRKDDYYVYIVYVLLFSKHDCNGLYAFFKLGYLSSTLDFLYELCPLFSHDVDIKFATLKYTKSGFFRSVKLSGSFSMIRKQYFASELSYNS